MKTPRLININRFININCLYTLLLVHVEIDYKNTFKISLYLNNVNTIEVNK